jgi:hypothetical protein
VRFVWTGASCAWCRRTLHLYTDRGRVEAGIRTSDSRTRGTARFYQIHRPASAPVPPASCPDPLCPSHRHRAPSSGVGAATGWMTGRWSLTAEAHDLCATKISPPGRPPPAHPQTWRLLSQVWDVLRAGHPGLATLADANYRRRHHLDR